MRAAELRQVASTTRGLGGGWKSGLQPAMPPNNRLTLGLSLLSPGLLFPHLECMLVGVCVCNNSEGLDQILSDHSPPPTPCSNSTRKWVGVRWAHRYSEIHCNPIVWSMDFGFGRTSDPTAIMPLHYAAVSTSVKWGKSREVEEIDVCEVLAQRLRRGGARGGRASWSCRSHTLCACAGLGASWLPPRCPKGGNLYIAHKEIRHLQFSHPVLNKIANRQHPTGLLIIL